MRHYWGTSPIGSQRTKPPISTPDAGVTGAEGPGGHGQASRSTTPSLHPRVWRSRGRPGPTVPRKPAAPQVPTRRSNGGRAERRPTQQREGAPVTGRCTRYGALHPLWAAAPDQKGCTAYGSGAAHPITRTNAESARQPPTHTRPRELALPGPQRSPHKPQQPARRELAPGPQHTAVSQRSTWHRRGRRRR